MKSTIRFVSYEFGKISIIGKFEAKVTCNGKTVSVNLYVSSKGTSIMGCDIFDKLGWSIQENPALVTRNIKGSPENVPGLPKGLGPEFLKYADCFKPLTESVKGYCHKVKMKADVKPVQQKLRRLPFAIRDDVSKELARLEKKGIIEKTDSSEFISPLVVVKKSNGSLRLCVDLCSTTDSGRNFSRYAWCQIFFKIRL